MTTQRTAREIERFWSKVDRTVACWFWTGTVDTSGYAVLARHLRGRWRNTLAHRFAYELLVGPIPEGLQLDHLCRIRYCVNPEHMEVVTLQENLRRGFGFAAVNSRKTHCIHGHEFTPENTYVFDGHRRCRACHRRDASAYRQRKAAS